MQYLVTAKFIYGLPYVVEADSVDDALANVMQGKAEVRAPFPIQSLPTAQWNIEPMTQVSAVLDMHNALAGVAQMFYEIKGLDYADPRVIAVYTSMAKAQRAIEESANIQRELDVRESDSALPSSNS